MLLPGPEAMQLASYVGWRLHRTAGGLAAGLLFVLPGACIVLALSIPYAFYGQVPLVEIALHRHQGRSADDRALTRVARRALRGPHHVAIAAAAFIAIFFFAAPFPLIIAGAALLGFLLPRVPPAAAAAPLKEPPVLLSRTLQTAALWLAIWIVPIVLLAAILGRTHVTTDVALFFSKLAIVTSRNRPLRLMAG
jgi:chromate transporter